MPVLEMKKRRIAGFVALHLLVVVVKHGLISFTVLLVAESVQMTSAKLNVESR